MDWSRFLANPVRVVAVAPATNASLDDLGPDLSTPALASAYAATAPGTALLASVQQAGDSGLRALMAGDALQAGIATHVAYFGAEPADPASARPDKRLRARDLILWSTPSGATRVLSLLGPARDEGGAGEAWSCDCEEIA